VNLRRAKRVRVHFFNDKMPSMEGLLVSRRHREYAIAVPELVPTVEGNKVPVGGQIALVPAGNVAFLEVLG
jgi:hypothetical protein